MKKTPCEELGYKIGDKFMVIDGTSFHYLDKGVIVTLYGDDGTESPKFKYPGGGDTRYIHLEDIVPMPNTITIPCPEGYVFDGVRCLNPGDSYLSTAEDIRKWTPQEKSIRKYIALKEIKPETMTLSLERKKGKTICKGEYYTDETNSNPARWDILEHTFEADSVKIWRVVSVETNNS